MKERKTENDRERNKEREKDDMNGSSLPVPS
jgi:hypothetical protein